MKHKRLCLTCKNKGCVSFCRFVSLDRNIDRTKISETRKEGAK